MSFKAELEISGGKTYRILAFSMGISQPADQHGVPREKTRCDAMVVSLESSGKDEEISEWATNSKMAKSGKILFYKLDSASVGKSIEFEQTFCTSMSISFVDSGTTPMNIDITLSPMKVTLNGKFVVASPVLQNNSSREKGGQTSSSGSENKPVSSFIAD